MNKIVFTIAKIIWLVFMLLVAFIMLYPFIFSLLAGANTMEEFSNMGKLLPIPQEPVFSNFAVIFTEGIINPLLNTIKRTVWYTTLATGVAILFGYAMARYDFKFKKYILGIIIITQIVPGVLTLIPSFIMMARMPFMGGNNWMGVGGSGLINNELMLYLPFGWGYLLWVFLFMQSMKSLPKEFEESAALDGCGFWRTIFVIVLPMQLSIVAVIAVNVALTTWNDWMTPFMYINDMQKSVLPAYIATLNSQLQSLGEKDYPKLFAVSTIAIIPPFLIFAFLQKYIVQGISSAGIKG